MSAIPWGDSPIIPDALLADVASAEEPVASQRSFCVYVAYSHAGAALYVGRTIRLPSRLVEHEVAQPWWSEVASIEVWHLGSAAAMALAERRLIRDLRPLHNVKRPAPL